MAHVINSLDVGGAERFLVELVNNLPRNEFDLHVICLFKGGLLAAELTSNDIPVTVLDLPRKISPKGYRAVYSKLRNGDFRIVHGHLLEGCWYSLPAAWAARVPVRIGHLQNTYPSLRLKLRLFDRVSFLFGTNAIACSQAVSDFYGHRMWYPTNRTRVVYNAVDHTHFDRRDDGMVTAETLRLHPREFVITTVASLTRQKGHHRLVEAAKVIVRSVPNARFLFVGDGALRSELEDLVLRSGLQSHVTFTGVRMDVPSILAQSDVFVLPSLWEGFALVLVEAGLASLPVVASKVDGVSEIITADENGILVSPEDSDGIASAVIRLAADRTLRQRLGARGRDNVVRRFSIENTVRQVATIYRESLSKSGS